MPVIPLRPRLLLAALPLLVAGCVQLEQSGAPIDPCAGIACDPGRQCDPATGVCAVVVACSPLTCTQAYPLCGAIPDGCAGELDCACPAGDSCLPGGRCAGPCTPLTCAELPGLCGSAPDGCGGTLACGTVRTLRCAADRDECGLQSDGCGAVIFCSCPDELVCVNGGARDELTRCAPPVELDCTRHGLRCGELPHPPGTAAVECPACGAGQRCDPLLHVCAADELPQCYQLPETAATDLHVRFAQETTLGSVRYLLAVLAARAGPGEELMLVPFPVGGPPDFAAAAPLVGAQLPGLGSYDSLQLRPDGLELFFAADHPDGAWWDLELYQSARVSTAWDRLPVWSPARPIGAGDGPEQAGAGTSITNPLLLPDYRTLLAFQGADLAHPLLLRRPTARPDDLAFEKIGVADLGVDGGTYLMPGGLAADLRHFLLRVGGDAPEPRSVHRIRFDLSDPDLPLFTDDGALRLLDVERLQGGPERVTESPDGQRLYLLTSSSGDWRLWIATAVPCP